MLRLIRVVRVPVVTILPSVAGAVRVAIVFEMATATATAETRKLRIALTAQISRIDRRDALLHDL